MDRSTRGVADSGSERLRSPGDACGGVPCRRTSGVAADPLRLALGVLIVVLVLLSTETSAGADGAPFPRSTIPETVVLPGIGASGVARPADLPSCMDQMVNGSPVCEGGQLVYDAVDGYALAQMTCIASTAPLRFDSCTWEYEGGSWSPVRSANGPEPPAVVGAALVWDAADGYVLLFGGDTYPTGGPLASTWTYRAGNWTDLTTAPVVTGAVLFSYLAAAYDSSDQRVVATYQTNAGTRGFDTYVYTYRAGTWTNLSASSPVPPGFAFRPLVADDPSDHGVLFYGGFTDASSRIARNSSWRFESGVWNSVPGSPAPPPLFGPSMSYDSVDGYILLVGGSIGGCPADPCAFSSAVWTFVQDRWSNVTAETKGAVPREWWGPMITDGAAGRILEGFGFVGAQSVQQSNLYEYSDGTWTEVPNSNPGSGPALDPILAASLIVAGALAVAAVLLLRRRHRGAP